MALGIGQSVHLPIVPASGHPRVRLAGLLLLVAGAGSACAGRLVLPAGPGVPWPDFAQPFAEATAGCRGVRTFSAELALSGRAAGRPVRRSRILAGLTAPDGVYIEAPAPFGGAAFVLGARDGRGTLLMARDGVAVADAPVADILDALAGLDLTAANLRGLLTGCVVPEPEPRRARRYRALAAVDLAQGAVAWLRRRDDRWRVVAGEDAGLIVEYSAFGPGPASTPRALRVRTASPDVAAVDLQVTISQVEMNVPLDPATFVVQVPPGVERITLDELRARAPLAP